MGIDLLAIGPHPDDAELGMGGTLARHAALGRSVAVIDLTMGEMGSNGDPVTRVREGEAAAAILGCRWRRNLGLPDRGLDHRDGEQVRRVVEAIRAQRPQIVAVNFPRDRHPDHQAGSRLVDEALFTAGLRRYETDLPAYRPARVLYYFINDDAEPSFYVDVTAFQAKKTESLFAHVSQFGQMPGAGSTAGMAAVGVAGAGEPVETRLNRAIGLPYLVEARDRLFGARCGVACAEGFISRQPLLIADLTELRGV